MDHLFSLTRFWKDGVFQTSLLFAFHFGHFWDKCYNSLGDWDLCRFLLCDWNLCELSYVWSDNVNYPMCGLILANLPIGNNNDHCSRLSDHCHHTAGCAHIVHIVHHPQCTVHIAQLLHQCCHHFTDSVSPQKSGFQLLPTVTSLSGRLEAAPHNAQLHNRVGVPW